VKAQWTLTLSPGGPDRPGGPTGPGNPGRPGVPGAPYNKKQRTHHNGHKHNFKANSNAAQNIAFDKLSTILYSLSETEFSDVK